MEIKDMFNWLICKIKGHKPWHYWFPDPTYITDPEIMERVIAHIKEEGISRETVCIRCWKDLKSERITLGAFRLAQSQTKRD